MKRNLLFGMTILAVNLLTVSVLGRTAQLGVRGESAPSAMSPAYCDAAHNVGNIGLGISNDGTCGIGLAVSGSQHDCFTGELLPNGEIPSGSPTRYLFGGALWIGAVVGADTLVSTGADGWSRLGNEFHPDELWTNPMVYRSTLDPDAPWSEGAVSEQDYIAVYRDTCRTCVGVSTDWSGRPHQPLNIEVTQSSYAWSLPHAKDFVLIDYSIKNIGASPLVNAYVGLYVDQDIHDLSNQNSGAQDDISGLWSGNYVTGNSPECTAEVGLDVAWSADNNGDLGLSFYEPVPNVTGLRVLRAEVAEPKLSFNWFVSYGDPRLDYGPMRRAIQRDFGTGGSGTPEGDRNKYYLLSNGDRDFDQVRCATIDQLDSIWIPPPNQAVIWSSGLDTRYVLSVGPVSLEPGQSTPFTVAYVGGENFHTDINNFNHLPYDPDAYLAGLGFDDFLSNAVWAGWVFDNPGVDTDSDGYAGDFKMCGDDTVWYQGDGIPDWRATTPPVGPTLWVEPREEALYVRWNGFGCETLRDWASREKRFEGYNAYLSTSGNFGTFSRIASYDREDYFRYYWDFAQSDWFRSPGPLTRQDVVCAYAPSGCDDSSWYPLDYTRQAPYVMPGHPDSLFYFEPCMANASRFGLETPFEKRFPLASRPPYLRPQDVPPDSVEVFLTEDGYFKYYEYEFTIDSLIPDQPYWVAVTSFEYSSVVPGAEPAESEVAHSAVKATPLESCCKGLVGNVNCDEGNFINVADVAALIDFLFISLTPPCCLEVADIDQSGGPVPEREDISVVDVAILIDYLYITGPSLGLPECY